MKSSPLKQNLKEPHLKVVNNSIGIKRKLSKSIHRIYINTLVPNFSYKNQNGETINPKKCILL